MFQVNHKTTRVFIVNFEHIPHFFIVFLLFTLNKLTLVGLKIGGPQFY